jgi:hypothetical protein
MMVLLVVPGKEVPTELLGVLDAAEALGKPRLILQGFEVAFRERVVVGGVRAAMRFRANRNSVETAAPSPM